MGQAEGRVAVITGGASGIGLAVARRCFLGLGMKVAIADIDQEGLKAALAEFVAAAKAAGRNPGDIFAKRCDVTSAEDTAALAAEVYARKGFGEVGFLFLNAGISVGQGVLGTSAATLRRQLDVNVIGVWHGIQAFVPAMIAQKTPCRVCTTGSIVSLINAGLAGVGGGTPYTISKHAVALLMEVLYAELRRMKGCQVSAHLLCPGKVDTAYWQRSVRDAGVDPERAFFGGRVGYSGLDCRPVESIVELLEHGMLAGAFYIKSDSDVPLELLHAMVQARSDDIKKGAAPFSELFDPAVRAHLAEVAKKAYAQQASAAKL